MSELISGKEVKLAWANDIYVEYMGEDFDWEDISCSNTLKVFEREDFKFRLKPKTILLNNIEVPAPFEPKEGETCWHLYPPHSNGFGWCYGDSGNNLQFGAWRTEDEIKQVVAALRKVFVINNQ